ncbi:uncharacterized protein TRIADDRAFT_54172 [Trichoplax adhaerens]|uniref:Uncharacterized protein n=1 Tax=Trichoplax adhaerens TaxID=10228 RepID=B3RRB2_TRIAD|nr:hypothetical protein TRIADDRAFT_54172 [Trichoplax adhaerens]EDV26847.1 hypothetical protein TRIADDRAFT_54172 [Trichoplax adhaerens]|eukprot:XP_002110843.1 hypothetical protein TRIADDRAFT_54172 [Trichoplax adhaerens]
MVFLACNSSLARNCTKYGLHYRNRLTLIGVRSISHACSFDWSRKPYHIIRFSHGKSKHYFATTFNANLQHHRLFVNRTSPNLNNDNNRSDNPAGETKIVTVDLAGRVLGHDFSKDSFLEGANQAMKMICDAISTDDYSRIEDLLSPEAKASAKQCKTTLDRRGWDIRNILNYNGQPLTQIFRVFPSIITIIYEPEGKKFIFICVRYLYVDLSSIQPETVGSKLFSEEGRISLRNDMKFIMASVRSKFKWLGGNMHNGKEYSKYYYSNFTVSIGDIALVTIVTMKKWFVNLKLVYGSRIIISK